MATCAINSWKTYGAKVETVIDFVFLDSTITVDSDCGHGIKKKQERKTKTTNKQKQQQQKNTLAPWGNNYDKPRNHIKTWRHHFANKYPSSQTPDFSNGHVWM